MSYATPTAMRSLVRTTLLSAYDDAALQVFLDNAFEEVNTYIASHHTLPLSTWPKRLVQAEVDIALWRLVAHQGVNPQQADVMNNIFYVSFQDTITWLKGVSSGTISLSSQTTTDATQDVNDGLPRVQSSTSSIGNYISSGGVVSIWSGRSNRGI